MFCLLCHSRGAFGEKLGGSGCGGLTLWNTNPAWGLAMGTWDCQGMPSVSGHQGYVIQPDSKYLPPCPRMTPRPLFQKKLRSSHLLTHDFSHTLEVRSVVLQRWLYNPVGYHPAETPAEITLSEVCTLTHRVSENGKSGSSLGCWILAVDSMLGTAPFILSDNFLKEVLGL